jgi:hypothetical protein
MLTACNLGIPDGKSIEDCMEIGYCYYSEKDVKTEGSEFADSLKELLVNEADDIVFTYSINPENDAMWIEYISSEDISVESLDELLDILKQTVEVISSYYDIDTIYTKLLYSDYIEVKVVINDSLIITESIAYINYETDYRN